MVHYYGPVHCDLDEAYAKFSASHVELPYIEQSPSVSTAEFQ
jgi:hypothetical protein